jgi:hypothetical protein
MRGTSILGAIVFIGVLSVSGYLDFRDEATTLRQGLENASKNIEQGAAHIMEGMAALAKVDPVGLRTVLEKLEKNESLQEYVKRPEKEIERVKNASDLVKVDGNSELLFRFTEMRGRFWIEARVDDRDKINGSSAHCYMAETRMAT